MFGKVLCWLQFHKWVTKLHFTDTHALDWTGCSREGCDVGMWTKQLCTYHGPDER